MKKKYIFIQLYSGSVCDVLILTLFGRQNRSNLLYRSVNFIDSILNRKSESDRTVDYGLFTSHGGQHMRRLARSTRTSGTRRTGYSNPVCRQNELLTIDSSKRNIGRIREWLFWHQQATKRESSALDYLWRSQKIQHGNQGRICFRQPATKIHFGSFLFPEYRSKSLDILQSTNWKRVWLVLF